LRSLIIKSLSFIFTILLIQSVFANGGGWTDTFQTNPLTNNWSYSGQTPALFSWNSTKGTVSAAWNSALSTSHYSHAPNLGFTLDQNHSFNLQFDVSFSYFSTGMFTNYPASIGFLNSANSYNRSANILEWYYYQGIDSTYGGPNWLGMGVINQNGGYYNTNGGYTFSSLGYTLQTGVVYHTNLNYNAGSRLLNMTVTSSSTTLQFYQIDLTGVNFTVDQLAMTNWFDDTPIAWGGPAYSQANGEIDNVQLSFPLAIEESYWTILQ